MPGSFPRGGGTPPRMLSMAGAAPAAQQGYMVDAKGRHVPVELVKPIDQTRDQLVRDLIDEARELNARMRTFKTKVLADLQAFLQLSAQQYDVMLGGVKGNVTLLSYDGTLRVQRQVADRIMFTEALQVAKELIDQCVRDWASDSRPEVRLLVEHAFQADREGKVSTERVLGLRKIDIQDERWTRAMAAIGDSLTVAGTATYVRFYEQRDGQWCAISLDLAAIPVADWITDEVQP